MGSDCSKLDQDMNACNIYECVDKIKGMSSDSNSVSDTMLLYFKDGVVYEGNPVESAFLKFWISPEIIDEMYEDIVDKDELVLKSESSLDYEIDIDKYVIKPLIDNNVCPNFVKYYSSAKNCTREHILKLIETNFDKEMAEIVLERNIKYLENRSMDRPSITDPEGEETEEQYLGKYPKPTLTFSLLINENISSNSSSILHRLLNSKISFSQDFALSVLFQLAVACYALSLSKTIHNDLHMNNIFIQKIPWTTVTYVIDEISYTFRTDNKVKVFDFNKSYCEKLGNNEFLDYDYEFFCEENGQCNEWVENKNIIQTFRHMYLYGKTPWNIIIANILEKELEYFNEKSTDTYEIWSPIDYTRFPSTSEIIEKLGSYVNRSDVIQSDNIFTCNSDMFNSDGSLLL